MFDNTNAERQARWRAKRAAELAELRKAQPDVALHNEVAALRDELERRDSHIAELQAEVDRLKVQVEPSNHDEPTELRVKAMTDEALKPFYNEYQRRKMRAKRKAERVAAAAARPLYGFKRRNPATA